MELGSPGFKLTKRKASIRVRRKFPSLALWIFLINPFQDGGEDIPAHIAAQHKLSKATASFAINIASMDVDLKGLTSIVLSPGDDGFWYQDIGIEPLSAVKADFGGSISLFISCSFCVGAGVVNRIPPKLWNVP